MRRKRFLLRRRLPKRPDLFRNCHLWIGLPQLPVELDLAQSARPVWSQGLLCARQHSPHPCSADWPLRLHHHRLLPPNVWRIATRNFLRGLLGRLPSPASQVAISCRAKHSPKECNDDKRQGFPKFELDEIHAANVQHKGPATLNRICGGGRIAHQPVCLLLDRTSPMGWTCSSSRSTPTFGRG